MQIRDIGNGYVCFGNLENEGQHFTYKKTMLS